MIVSYILERMNKSNNTNRSVVLISDRILTFSIWWSLGKKSLNLISFISGIIFRISLRGSYFSFFSFSTFAFFFNFLLVILSAPLSSSTPSSSFAPSSPSVSSLFSTSSIAGGSYILSTSVWLQKSCIISSLLIIDSKRVFWDKLNYLVLEVL